MLHPQKVRETLNVQKSLLYKLGEDEDKKTIQKIYIWV